MPRVATAALAVNPLHPLSNGLGFCYVPGVRSQELDSGVVPTMTAVTSGLSPFGQTAVMTASSSSVAIFRAPDYLFLRDITVLWIGTVNDSGVRSHHFFGKHAGNGGSHNPLDFGTNTANQVQIVRANGGSFTPTTFNQATLSTGVLTHVALTVANGASSVYLDGVVKQTGSTQVVTTGTNDDIRIGRRADGGRQLDGSVVAVMVWTRALRSDEIAALYNDPFQHLERPYTTIILNGGVSGTPAQNIGASTGTITLTGVAGAITPSGGPTIGGATGTITLTGVPGAITPGGANIGGATGTVTLTGVAGAISASGAASIGAGTGTITLTGVPGAISFPATADSNALKLTYRERGHTLTYRERA